MNEQTQPTDAEIEAAWTDATGSSILPYPDDMLAFARAVLAKWGTPAGAGEPEGWITWFRTPNGSREPIYSHGPKKPSHGAELDALLRKYPLYTTPQPTQAQAGAVPLKYARLHAISLDYSDSEDECTGFRDGWRAAEKHHGIKGADHA